MKYIDGTDLLNVLFEMLLKPAFIFKLLSQCWHFKEGADLSTCDSRCLNCLPHYYRLLRSAGHVSALCAVTDHDWIQTLVDISDRHTMLL